MRFKCPNGTRQKPPKSGNCVEYTPKSPTKKNKTYSPKFYNVAKDIFPGYNGHMGFKIMNKDLMIKNYIDQNKFNTGDILFVGKHAPVKLSTDFRIIVHKDGKQIAMGMNHHDAVSLPIKYRKYLPDCLDYSNMLSKAYKTITQEFGLEFFDATKGTEDAVYNDILTQYKAHNLICKKLKPKNTKRVSKQKMEYSPKFHNIAADVFPTYPDLGYISKEYDKEDGQLEKMVQDYVDGRASRFNPGDIIYTGSTYQTRQYSDAFAVISTTKKVIGYRDDAVSIPILYHTHLPANLHYQEMLDKQFEAMFTETGSDEDAENLEFGQWFFATDGSVKEECQEDYQSLLNEYNKKNLL